MSVCFVIILTTSILPNNSNWRFILFHGIFSSFCGNIGFSSSKLIPNPRSNFRCSSSSMLHSMISITSWRQTLFSKQIESFLRINNYFTLADLPGKLMIAQVKSYSKIFTPSRISDNVSLSTLSRDLSLLGSFRRRICSPLPHYNKI